MKDLQPRIQDDIERVNDVPQGKSELLSWFVMRDLKRYNAKLPAYKMLEEMGIEVFTPMVWKLAMKNDKRHPEKVPFIRDLLFVHETRDTLDPIVEKTNTLQYRYVRGGYKIPMTVRDADMQRFIQTVQSSENPVFYKPQDLSDKMIGKKVRIIGGPLNGYEGCLQKIQGTRIKRLFVDLPGILTASVEVQPEYIEFL